MLTEIQQTNTIHHGVFAKVVIPKDTIILHLEGVVIQQPTKYSIQVGIHQHCEIPEEINPFSTSAFHWKFLNHSCSPNGYFNMEDKTFRALKNILSGEEISFNYNTTEYELAAPFQCRCHSANCYGEIKGFRYLSLEERNKTRPLLASHLLQYLL